MNVTPALRTILCAGVTHLVLPRGTTELLGRSGEKMVLRERVRLRPKAAGEKAAESNPPADSAEGLPGR